jgi:hypothetical protein
MPRNRSEKDPLPALAKHWFEWWCGRESGPYIAARRQLSKEDRYRWKMTLTTERVALAKKTT